MYKKLIIIMYKLPIIINQMAFSSFGQKCANALSRVKNFKSLFGARKTEIKNAAVAKKTNLVNKVMDKYNRVNKILKYTKYGIVGGTSLGIFSYVGYSYSTYRELVISVSTKQTLPFGEQRLLTIVADDEQTYRFVNNILYLHLRGPELWGRIKEGGTYKFGVYGYRIRPFKIFPNIITALEISKPEQVVSQQSNQSETTN